MVLLTLNWNLEVINYFIGAFLTLISSFMIFREFLRTKHKFYSLIMSIWIILTIYLAIGGIALLYLSINMFKMVDLILIPLAILIIHVLDLINRGSLGPIKMLIFGITATGLIHSYLGPDPIITTTIYSGHPSYQNAGAYFIWSTIYFFQIVLFYFAFCLLIYIKSPKSVKKKAMLTLLGGSSLGVFSFISYVSGLTKIIPGIMMVLIGITGIISSLSFTLEPQMLKVLITSARNAKLKIVSNILTVCSHCKKIKNDEETWCGYDEYFSKNSKILFSHGLCPSCMKEHYAEFLDDD